MRRSDERRRVADSRSPEYSPPKNSTVILSENVCDVPTMVVPFTSTVRVAASAESGARERLRAIQPKGKAVSGEVTRRIMALGFSGLQSGCCLCTEAESHPPGTAASVDSAVTQAMVKYSSVLMRRI